MKGGQGHEPLGGSGEVDAGGPGLSEELLERARADDAEARCLEHETRIAELEQELSATREALDASERRRQIERVLGESHTVDLETARLMTEATVAQMDEPDVVIAIEELRRRKPFLFQGDAASGAGRGIAMRPAPEQAGSDAALDGLADEARRSGDRRALLQYLRQRRC